MAKKATQLEALEEAKKAPEQESAQEEKLNQDLFADFSEEDALNWNDAEEIDSGKDFDEFLKIDVGASYTGKFVGDLPREGKDEMDLYVFEDYPSKGYKNLSAINQYSSLVKVFSGEKPSNDIVYRITLHKVVEIKNGRTWKDFRVKKAKLNK